jgi:hypothetical protein
MEGARAEVRGGRRERVGSKVVFMVVGCWVVAMGVLGAWMVLRVCLGWFFAAGRLFSGEGCEVVAMHAREM